MLMNYEKKYKNLVEAIKKFRDLNCHDEGIRNWVNDNVPELTESEDERIRKALLELFSKVDKKDWRGVPNEKIVAWLKKQGNQKEQLINKACDVLVNCIEDFMLRRMEVWSEESKKKTLENIHKKLEE